MSASHYDLVVIGSGPAGEKGAAQAAYFGKRVALIEKRRHFGGAAANTGTLPSKTLRETAVFLAGLRQRDLHGIDVTLKDRVTVGDLLHRERLVVQAERDRVSSNLDGHKIDIVPGRARFLDPHRIEVTDREGGVCELTGEVILIATGSRPHRPIHLPFHDGRVYDSDSILAMKELPRSLVVAGGGVIGCEYACIFAALGCTVTLVDGRDALLGFLDTEVSSALTAKMRGMGIELLLSEEIEGVGTERRLDVRLNSGRTIAAESLLAATGRAGGTETLGLENIGLEPTRRGLIEVNENYQTRLSHIYAAGDVIGFPALASTSMEQARLAMVHAFDLKYKRGLARILPYGIYTIPECSMAGATEQSLSDSGVPYVVGRARYAANARGQIIGEQDGFLKLLFHRENRRLLGVHVFGESASELVHTGLTAMLMEATTDLFIQTCYNYPTLTEMYKYAAYDALGRLRGEGVM